MLNKEINDHKVDKTRTRSLEQNLKFEQAN